jgi:hypothetical protein
MKNSLKDALSDDEKNFEDDDHLGDSLMLKSDVKDNQSEAAKFLEASQKSYVSNVSATDQ